MAAPFSLCSRNGLSWLDGVIRSGKTVELSGRDLDMFRRLLGNLVVMQEFPPRHPARKTYLNGAAEVVTDWSAIEQERG